MKRLTPNELSGNFIQMISQEWMLVTAGNEEKFNTMTANWGGMGFLWNKPVAYVFIRPERYTFEFIESNDYFTLSFMGEEHKGVHKIFGSKSGRDMDKIAATGLHPFTTENGNILFEEARVSLECRKLYTEMLKEDNFLDKSIYPKWYDQAHGNPHKMYVAEIVNGWVED